MVKTCIKRPSQTTWSLDHGPLYINRSYVERGTSFKFLGVHTSEELSWSPHATAVTKKARQRLHFLYVLRKDRLEQKLPVSFYYYTTESLLNYGLTARTVGGSAADRAAQQRVISIAQKTVSCPLPHMEEIALHLPHPPAASEGPESFFQTHQK